MRIQNNITAVNSHRQLSGNYIGQSKSMEKLSSGYRVNRAADDAAGLAISEKMRTQIRGLSMASRNVQDGISLLQVADGAMQTAADIIQRMREISAQAANGTNDDPLDRKALDLEYQQLLFELDQIADTTNFNGVYPLKGDGMGFPYRAGMTGTKIPSGGEYTTLPNTYNGPSVKTATMPTTSSAISINLTALNITEVTPTTTSTLGTVSGVLNISASDSVRITGPIAAGTVINIEDGGSLVIDCDVAGITINGDATGRSDIRVNGNFAGTVNGAVRMTATGDVDVVNNTTGTDNGIRIITPGSTIRNSGTGNTLVANTAGGSQVLSNTGYMQVAASGSNVTNDFGGTMHITGATVTVPRNSGDMHITANNTNITLNEGNLRSSGSTSGTITIGTNEGEAHLVAASGSTRFIIGTNDGHAFINSALSSSTLGSRVSVSNNGWLEVNGHNTYIESNSGDLTMNGNTLTIVTNTKDGIVTVPTTNGINVTDNHGEMSISSSASATATIGTNTNKLVVTGGISVVGTNDGEALLQGVTATVTTNNGDLRMTGTAATSVLTLTNNYKSVVMVNNNAAGSAVLTNNYDNATARIDSNNASVGTNYAKAVIDLYGNAARIATNNGMLKAKGTNTEVNRNAGSIRFDTDSNARVNINNGGNILVAGDTTLTRLAFNDTTGIIVVEDGGKIIDAAGDNAGKIYANENTTVSIQSNLSGAEIVSRGDTIISGSNAGYIEAGVWVSDFVTPKEGSTGSLTIGGSNTGLIRNFTANMNFTGSNAGGEVENYGTTTIPAPVGDLRHHARLLDVQGISWEPPTVNVVFWANGLPYDVTDILDDTTGTGRELELAFSDPGGGQIIFDAWTIPNVPNIAFDIQDRFNVEHSSGTSGFTLKFTYYEGFYIQSGANEGDVTELSFRSLNTMLLGVQDDAFSLGASHIRDIENASRALTVTKDAINDISLYRAELGAQYNRLEFTYDNLGVSTENLADAESRIRDTDMAKEMTVLTKNNILVQSATAMLAQANALPQGVLQLLG